MLEEFAWISIAYYVVVLAQLFIRTYLQDFFSLDPPFLLQKTFLFKDFHYQ